jgi:hypothetical protein
VTSVVVFVFVFVFPILVIVFFAIFLFVIERARFLHDIGHPFHTLGLIITAHGIAAVSPVNAQTGLERAVTSGTTRPMAWERSLIEFLAAAALDCAASSRGYTSRTSWDSFSASRYMAIQVSGAQWTGVT